MPAAGSIAPGSRSIGARRTALISQLRAILLERGTTIAQGQRKLERPSRGPQRRHVA